MARRKAAYRKRHQNRFSMFLVTLVVLMIMVVVAVCQPEAQPEIEPQKNAPAAKRTRKSKAATA